jgi:hypothetical protein
MHVSVRVRDKWFIIHCDTCPHLCISNNNSNIDDVVLDAEHTMHGPPGAATAATAATAAARWPTDLLLLLLQLL